MAYSNPKNFLFLIFFISVTTLAAGQSLTKRDAKNLMERTLSSLKNSDTTSFVKLWYLDNASRPYHQSAFTEQNLIEHFVELRKFLDTALARDLKIEDIEIEKQDKHNKNYSAQYKITGWFHYDKTYKKGFAFNVDRIDNNWFYRFEPDYSKRMINPASNH